MIVLNQVPTVDTYPNEEGCQLPPAPNVTQINFSEGGTGDFYAQFAIPLNFVPGKWAWEQIEHYYPESNSGAFVTSPIAGVRFRSATKGQPATISADQIFVDDPVIVAGSPTKTAVLPATKLNFEHNNSSVGSEATLNFEDDSDIDWVVTDNVGVAVSVSGSVAATRYKYVAAVKIVSNVTCTNSGETKIADLGAQTLPTGNFLLEYWVSGYSSNETAESATVELSLDGGSTSIGVFSLPLTNAVFNFAPVYMRQLLTLSAGNYTPQLYGKTSNGTITFLAGNAAASPLPGSFMLTQVG